MHRILCALGTAVLMTALLTTDATPARADAEPVPACSDGGPRPCLVSATRDGAPLPADYRINARTETTPSGAQVVALTALHHGQDDLGAGDLGSTWSVTVDLGDIAPRVVAGKATDVSVERAEESSVVTVTGRPVTVSGQCRRAATPWRCPEFNPVQDPDNRDRAAIFRITITDATDWAWSDDAQMGSASGLSVFVNVAGVERPALMTDRTTRSRFLRVPLGSHRFREDGTTLVNGRLQVRLPHPLLQSLYRIDDPASMTGAGLRVSGAGDRARTTVTQDPAGEAVLVDVARIRFKEGGQVRRVGIERGVLTPTRPTITRGSRCCERRLVLEWTAGTPRGSAITGYKIRCVSTGTGHVITVAPVSADSNWRKVTGLRLEPYDCAMRTLSEAGPSRWSPVKHVAGP